jgi:hypothetical protein
VGRRALVGAAAGLLALAACSGDDATDGGPVGTLAPNSVEGAVLTTDPGTAYTEVGGERVEYQSSSSVGYTCDIEPDRIVVSFQTPTGEQLSLQAVPDGSDWLGQLTFGSADDTGVRYVAVVGPGSGILGVGDVTVSFQGPAERVEVGSLAEPEQVQVEVAAHCAG